MGDEAGSSQRERFAAFALSFYGIPKAQTEAMIAATSVSGSAGWTRPTLAQMLVSILSDVSGVTVKGAEHGSAEWFNVFVHAAQRSWARKQGVGAAEPKPRTGAVWATEPQAKEAEPGFEDIVLRFVARDVLGDESLFFPQASWRRKDDINIIREAVRRSWDVSVKPDVSAFSALFGGVEQVQAAEEAFAMLDCTRGEREEESGREGGSQDEDDEDSDYRSSGSDSEAATDEEADDPGDLESPARIARTPGGSQMLAATPGGRGGTPDIKYLTRRRK
jgi:hypothetical protein